MFSQRVRDGEETAFVYESVSEPYSSPTFFFKINFGPTHFIFQLLFHTKNFIHFYFQTKSSVIVFRQIAAGRYSEVVDFLRQKAQTVPNVSNVVPVAVIPL